MFIYSTSFGAVAFNGANILVYNLKTTMGIVVVMSAITIKMLDVTIQVSQIEEMHLMLSQIHTG
jgi:TctA family transporter